MAKKSGFTLVELLLTSCVIFALIGFFAVCANVTLRAARETALQNELAHIRLAIEHFLIDHNRLPDSLTELLKNDLTFNPGKDNMNLNKYLDHERIAKSGKLLDPFMKEYIYDKGTGRVFSSIKRYQGW